MFSALHLTQRCGDICQVGIETWNISATRNEKNDFRFVTVLKLGPFTHSNSLFLSLSIFIFIFTFLSLFFSWSYLLLHLFIFLWLISPFWRVSFLIIFLFLAMSLNVIFRNELCRSRACFFSPPLPPPFLLSLFLSIYRSFLLSFCITLSLSLSFSLSSSIRRSG